MGAGLSPEVPVNKLNALLSDARDGSKSIPYRASQLDNIRQLLLTGRESVEIHRLVVSSEERLRGLVDLLHSGRVLLIISTLRLLTHLSNSVISVDAMEICRVCSGELVDLLDAEEPDIRKLVVETIANLSTDETNQKNFAEKGAVMFLVEYLSSTHMELQLESARAVFRLSQTKDLRDRIVTEGGLLPLVGLCFVGNMYGMTRHYALQAIANLTKEEAARKVLIRQNTLPRLTKLARRYDSMMDAQIQQLVSAIFSNFSLAEDTTAVPSYEAIPALYTLIFSDTIDYVVEGIWAIANYCGKEESKRKEVIDTDGIKVLFSLLKVREVQIWFEVSRCILNISAGGDWEKETLIKEGALTALMNIFTWCSEERSSFGFEVYRKELKAQRKRSEFMEFDTLDHFYDEHEDVEQQARYMTMAIAMHALKNLTTLPGVSESFLGMQGGKPLMALLRMEFNSEGQQHAASVLGNMAQNNECCRKLVADGAIESLIDLLKLSIAPNVHREAAQALTCIAKNSKEYLRIIIENGGVTALANLLKKDLSADTAYNVVNCLAVLQNQESQMELVRTDGMAALIKYAGMSDTKLQAVCAQCLKHLAEMNDDHQLCLMVNEGIFPPLVGMMNSDNNKVVVTAAELISKLTMKIDSSKEMFYRTEGALNAVVDHLDSEATDVLYNTLNILGNIASLEEVREALLQTGGNVVEKVCAVLQSGRSELTMQAMRTLVHLTSNKENAKRIPEEMSIDRIMDMTTSSDHHLLQKHAITVVANLAAAEENWETLMNADVLNVLKGLVEENNSDIKLQAVRGIANLSEFDQAIQVIDEMGIVDSLAKMLKASAGQGGTEKQKRASDAHMVQRLANYMEVKNMKLQVQLFIALKNLCKTEHILERLLSEYESLSVFITTLESKYIDVRKEAAACLATVAENPGHHEEIIQLGGKESVMKGLKTSVAMTAEIDREIIAAQHKLEEDNRIKDNAVQQQRQTLKQRSGPAAFQSRSALTKGVGLSYEDRELQMIEIEHKNQRKAQNSELQEEFMKIIYYLCEDETVLTSFITTWEWNLFMAPLALPGRSCQEWASRACFRLVTVGKKLNKFVQGRGVYYVLRALQFEDEDLKRLSAQTLGQISVTDRFQESVLSEGGVGVLLNLIKSDDSRIVRSAFQAVSLLCTNIELVQMFVSQGMLSIVYEANSKWGEQDPEMLNTIVLVIVTVATNDVLRLKVLESGGVELLLQSCNQKHLSLVKMVMKALMSLATKDDIRDAIVRSRWLPRLTAVLRLYAVDIIKDALQVIFNICSKEQYRKEMYSDQLVKDVLELLDEAEIPQLMQRRKANAYKADPSLKELEENGEARSDNSQLRMRVMQRAKDQKKVEQDKEMPKNVVLMAVKTLGTLVSIDKCKNLIVGHGQGFKMIIAMLKSSVVELKWQTARIVGMCSQLQPLHGPMLQAGVFQAIVDISRSADSTGTENKRQAAKMFAAFANNSATHKQFEDAAVIAAIKSLAMAKSHKDIQASCAQAICSLSVVGKICTMLVNSRVGDNIVAFLEADSDSVKGNGLSALTNLSAEYARVLRGGASKADEMKQQIGDLLSKVIAIFKSSARESDLCASSINTLRTLVASYAEYYGAVLLEKGPTLLKDIKSLLLVRPRGKPSTQGGSGLIDHRVPAAEILLCISRVDAIRSNMLRTVGGVDDLVALGTMEENECLNLEFLVAISTIIANIALSGSQRDKLLKSSALKFLVTLLGYDDPRLVHAACFALSTLAESTNRSIKIVQGCSMDEVITVLLKLVERIDKTGVDPNNADSVRTCKAMYETCRLLNVLSDNESGQQVLRGPSGDKLQKSGLAHIMKMQFYELLWQIQGALCRQKNKPPTHSTSVTAEYLGNYVTQLQEQSDLVKVEAGAAAVAQLVKQARSNRDQALMKQVVEKDIVSLLISLMKSSNDQKIFIYCAWALVELAMDHSDIRKRIIQEGMGGLVKIANSSSDVTRFIASKLLTICLREPMAFVVLQKNKLPLALPCAAL